MINRLRQYSGVFHPGAHRRSWGLAAAPRDNADSVEEHAIKLRTRLENRGPVHSSFALYLSSRIDFLPAEYCRELALTGNTFPPLSPSQVELVMTGQLGATFRSLFKGVAPVPITSGPIVQTHLAELVNGEAVKVFVLRPEYCKPIEVTQFTDWLNQAGIRGLSSDVSNTQIAADFIASLRRATDLRLRAGAFAQNAPGSAMEKIGTGRKVYRELSGKSILTVSFTPDKPLDQLLTTGQGDVQAIARVACRGWLWDSLSQGLCPVDPRAANITAAGMAIHFDGNEFVEFPRRTKDNLWRYLLATMEDDPDIAAQYLLQEMVPPKWGVAEVGEFRSKFRQAAYFGALEPVLGTNTNALAQLIFQHWRTALDYGYTPTNYLLCFYRGLFSIARVARELAPTDDPLREALKEMDAIVTINQFKDIAAAGYWYDNSEKFATAMINFPRALNESLNQAARTNLSGWNDSSTTHSSRKRPSLMARAALGAAAIVFLLRGVGNNWMEKGVLLLLMIAGLLVLQAGDE